MKMLSQKTALVFIAMLFIFSACKKEKKDDPSTSETNSENTDPNLIAAFYFKGTTPKNDITNGTLSFQDNAVSCPTGEPCHEISRKPWPSSNRFNQENEAAEFVLGSYYEEFYEYYYNTSFGFSQLNTSATNYTYSFWFKTDYAGLGTALSIGGSGGDQFVQVSKTQIRYTSYYNELSQVNIGSNLNTSFTVNHTQSNVWAHATITRSNSTMKIYVNGVEVGSVEIVSEAPHPYYSTDLVRLGSRYDQSAPYSGYLDEVRIFKKAMTATEVLAEYNYSKVSIY